MSLEPTWQDVELVAVDIEGNGQNPPDIVEISTVQMAGLAIGRRQSWLLKPRRPISAHSFRIHGISNSLVAQCPEWADVADEVRRALGHRCLVAHHAPVERGLLRRHLAGWSSPYIIDTLLLARRVRKGLGSYRLTALMGEYNLKERMASLVAIGPHRAEYDALATAYLLKALVAKEGQRTISFIEVARATKYDSPGSQMPLFADSVVREG